MSFGVSSVIPYMVSDPLPAIINRWVATPLQLEDIISQTMTWQYAQSHVPVFSSKDWGHFTIIHNSLFVLGGRKVSCDTCFESRLSSTSKRLKDGSGAKKWTIECSGCKRITIYKLPDADFIRDEDAGLIRPIPGTSMVRVPYPVPRASVEWRDRRRAPALTSGSDAHGGSSQFRTVGGQPPVLVPGIKRSRQPSDSSGRSRKNIGQGEGGSSGLRRKRSKNCESTLPILSQYGIPNSQPRRVPPSQHLNIHVPRLRCTIDAHVVEAKRMKYVLCFSSHYIQVRTPTVC
jgi:hypothetical protein